MASPHLLLLLFCVGIVIFLMRMWGLVGFFRWPIFLGWCLDFGSFESVGVCSYCLAGIILVFAKKKKTIYPIP